VVPPSSLHTIPWSRVAPDARIRSDGVGAAAAPSRPAARGSVFRPRRHWLSPRDVPDREDDRLRAPSVSERTGVLVNGPRRHARGRLSRSTSLGLIGTAEESVRRADYSRGPRGISLRPRTWTASWVRGGSAYRLAHVPRVRRRHTSGRVEARVAPGGDMPAVTRLLGCQYVLPQRLPVADRDRVAEA
jgi:hypothetical protein